MPTIRRSAERTTGDDDPTGEVDDAFDRIALLSDLPRRHRRRLARAARVEHLPAGDYLFHQGDAAELLAFVVSGRLQAVDEDGPRPVSVGLLGQGAVAGELSLLTGKPRSVGIRAQRDSLVVVLPAEAFHRLLEDEPRVGVELARSLAAQLQARDDRVPTAPTPDTFCIVPGDAGEDLDRFVAALRRSLGPHGPVGVIGPPPPAEAGDRRRWGARLDEMENGHTATLLLAPHPEGDPDWARFCIGSADRTLVLLRGGSPPDWAADGLLAGADLVFTGWPPNDARMGPTLDALDPRAHHLLPADDRHDGAVARIARRLTGRALGLVFSGGGARGFAHLGAIAALEEAGITVDRVGGCSAGAFAAALVGLGHGATEAEAVARDAFVERNPFTDVGMPRVSLLRGRRMAAALERAFGDATLEELERATFCVSSDLASGELWTHRRGSVRDAVGASMALPGLMPPVRSGRRVLVDGGMLDNFPVDLMDADGEGPVIGVDVMASFPGAGDDPLVATPGELGIVSILARAFVLGGRARSEQNRALADLVIAPDVDDVGFFAFDRIDDAIAAGRRAAEEALAGWDPPPA